MSSAFLVAPSPTSILARRNCTSDTFPVWATQARFLARVSGPPATRCFHFRLPVVPQCPYIALLEQPQAMSE